MKVLVDTPIWSYALRSRKKEYQCTIEQLESLIKDQRALIIGPIRQEILSGYSDFRKFKKLREKLSYFENSLIQNSDYESAAEMCNLCRRKGIQGSHIDFLICAVAIRLDVPIFSTDKDFLQYRKVLPLKLFDLEVSQPQNSADK
ncbi:MAG: PIN domain-containing protein [Thermodesulfobacteriota bacterium]|nr:PIN domain-containing protein [Thermodesulfobacteriota bacterium]